MYRVYGIARWQLTIGNWCWPLTTAVNSAKLRLSQVQNETLLNHFPYQILVSKWFPLSKPNSTVSTYVRSHKHSFKVTIDKFLPKYWSIALILTFVIFKVTVMNEWWDYPLSYWHIDCTYGLDLGVIIVRISIRNT